jgi:hypothetical protein
MHHALPTDAQPNQCPRCGGKQPSGERPARSERMCGCWDPDVEWLLDRVSRQ